MPRLNVWFLLNAIKILTIVVIIVVIIMIIGAQAVSASGDDYPVRLYDVNCTDNDIEILQCQLKLTLKGEEYSHCSSGVAGVFCQGMF